jgi:glycosyltransferase involved in cell wall biosynthesis
MHILHVTPYMHPSAGGPPVAVEQLVRETNARGHTAEIVTSTRFFQGDEAELLNSLEALAATTLVPDSLPGMTLPIRKDVLKEPIRRADVVHVHTLWSPLNSAVRRDCRDLDRPYVLMPHGMLDPHSLSVRRWRKWLYLQLIEMRNIRAAARMIYTTSEEARLAASALRLPPPAAVVSLGGDAPVEDVNYLSDAFYRVFPETRGRRQILSLGRLHPKKGIDRLLRVLPKVRDQYPDILLTLVGDGDSDFESKLRATINDLKLGEAVLFTGRLNGIQKWGAFATAEVFVLPSYQENFAIAVAEAMQMGLPVIITDKVNTWPSVKAANAGAVLGGEAIEPQLIDAISTLLMSEGLRREMGSRGREYAKAHFTWRRAAADLLRCYEEVVSEWRA